MKRAIMVLVFLGMCFFSQAKKTRGFIVKVNMDTVFGEIKLHKFERFTGAFLLSSYDLNWCFFSVSFKGPDDKYFKNYKPFELHSYQFTYDHVVYKFKSFEVYFTRLINQTDEVPKFLQEMYKGEISLYRDLIYSPQMAENAKFYFYYDYYLFNMQKGLVKVERTEKRKTVKDLLREFEVNPEFIEELSPAVRFKDIGTILDQYSYWQRQN